MTQNVVLNSRLSFFSWKKRGERIMKIMKVINNNVVNALDKNNNEIIVMGRGIAYRKQKGDDIDESLIEKHFSLTDFSTSNQSNQFKKLVEEIPYEYLKVADEIIKFARKSLNIRLNRNIYIALTDHLNFALQRHKQGILIKNALLWEIKRFYKKEFATSLQALKIVKKRLDVELPEDEAGFITLHIVNAGMDGNIEESSVMPAIIHDILNIIKYHYNIDLDEDTLSYERFITHLKFFIQRAVNKEGYQSEEDTLYETICENYKEAYKGALKIKEYMLKKMKYDVGNEELTYLTIHIERIINRK